MGLIRSWGVDCSSFGRTKHNTHVTTPQAFTDSEVIYGAVINVEGAFGFMYYPAYVFGASAVGLIVKAYLGPVNPPLNDLPNLEVLEGETKQSLGELTFAEHYQFPFYIPLNYGFAFVKLALNSTTPDGSTMAGSYALTGMR